VLQHDLRKTLPDDQPYLDQVLAEIKRRDEASA
jgi:hypothetical protein